MRYPAALPKPLQRRAFTRAQLAPHGISPDRLRRQDILALGPGVYAIKDWAQTLDDIGRHRATARAIVESHPRAWVSHSSAALLLPRLALPSGTGENDVVHLSVPRGAAPLTRKGVVCHRVRAAPYDVAEHPRIRGVRLSRPERIFQEMAATCSTDELVALGDSLVREPYHWAEQRDEAHTAVAALHRAVERAGRFEGSARARDALALIRVGADSAKETALRLALVGAGLPEPELQVELKRPVGSARRGDAGYPRWGVVIQYDGGTHYSPERHRKDQRRDNDWTAAGWLVLRLNIEDDRDGYRIAVAQVLAALRSRGYPG